LGSTDTRFTSVDTRLNNLVAGSTEGLREELLQETRRGIAAASALMVVNSPVQLGETTIDVGVANYQGASAIGIGVGHMVAPGVVINGGVSSAGPGDTVIRAGVGWRFK
jgi:autotransporter adhesin